MTPFPEIPRELFDTDEQYREYLKARYCTDVDSEIKAFAIGALIAVALFLWVALFVRWCA